MDKHDLVLLAVVFLAVFIPLFIAWYLVRRARFKELIILIEKGIDIKDLNLMVNKKGIIVIMLNVSIRIVNTIRGN